MMITVTDLFDGVTPETSPVTITVVEGSATTGGGGGAVDSVNGEVGVVVLDATDVGADASGAAATAQAAAEATAASALSTHAADTTAVHGIADTSVLATDAEVATAVSDHAAAANPHPTYLTAAEGDAAYDALGAAATAQAASQPVDSDLTTIAALDSATAGALVTDGSGWIRKTYAQLKTALSLVKADVGLGSVDNTADTAKPVSTAQQTALDLKANLASPTFTGTVAAPTPTAADSTTKVATTAFVQGEITAKAPLASPTFTGDPKAPTASPGDNDTSIATTAFVTAAVAAGGGSGVRGIDNATDFNTAFPGTTFLAYEGDDSGTGLPTGASWVNQGTSALARSFDALVMTPQTGSESLRLAVWSLSGAPSTWDAVAKVSMIGVQSNWQRSGMAMRDSGASSIMAHALVQSGNIHTNKWSSPTVFSSAVNEGTGAGISFLVPVYLRIHKNSGTSYDYYWSQDGVIWVAHSTASNPSMTIDQLGFIVAAGSSVTKGALHWLRIRG